MRPARRLSVALALLVTPSSAELLGTWVLFRHGARAPNPSVQQLCPKVAGDAAEIERDFGVPPGGLTAQGKAEMFGGGRMLRDRYLSGSDPLLTRETALAGGAAFTSPMRPPGTPTGPGRHYESAQAVGLGLLDAVPAAHGLYQGLLNADDMLACPPASCKIANQMSVNWWLRTIGDQGMLSPAGPVIKAVGRICGREIHNSDNNITALKSNPHPPLQDIVDLLDFREEAGLRAPPGWAPPLDAQAHALNYRALIDRMYSQPAQVLFWMGSFMDQLLTGMRSAASARPGPARLHVFVSSRERHYAFAPYFRFNFAVPGCDAGYVPPGTGIVWELHRNGGALEVRMLYIVPKHEYVMPHTDQTVAVTPDYPGCRDGACPFDTFASIPGLLGKQAGGKGFKEVCAAVVAAGGDFTEAAAAMRTETAHEAETAHDGGVAREAARHGQQGWATAAAVAAVAAAAAAVAAVRRPGAAGTPPLAAAQAQGSRYGACTDEYGDV